MTGSDTRRATRRSASFFAGTWMCRRKMRRAVADPRTARACVPGMLDQPFGCWRSASFGYFFFAQAKRSSSTAEWLVKVTRAPQVHESCSALAFQDLKTRAKASACCAAGFLLVAAKGTKPLPPDACRCGKAASVPCASRGTGRRGTRCAQTPAPYSPAPLRCSACFHGLGTSTAESRKLRGTAAAHRG